jgi:hypothetical protein
MNRTERRLLDLANLLVGGTGIVYAVMKYAMEATDEWAVVNHPWQPHIQHLHVLAAPLLVFAGGLFWKHHVLEKMRGNGATGRVTGLALAVQFIPLVFSGYLIQVSVSEAWRTTWIWVHLITGGLWFLLAMSHRFRSSTDKERGD